MRHKSVGVCVPRAREAGQPTPETLAAPLPRRTGRGGLGWKAKGTMKETLKALSLKILPPLEAHWIVTGAVMGMCFLSMLSPEM